MASSSGYLHLLQAWHVISKLVLGMFASSLFRLPEQLVLGRDAQHTFFQLLLAEFEQFALQNITLHRENQGYLQVVSKILVLRAFI
jgi:hypothetical protein